MDIVKNKVEKILEEHDFLYCEYNGCFDIAARREITIILKTTHNVDSLQERQAINLSILSRSLNAFVAVIGYNTRREKLDNGIIYERFDIPAFTPRTLENIIERNFPRIYRNRGGYFIKVSSEKLREARNEKGLTQKELADSVGINKKAVFEHEQSDRMALLENAEKMENILEREIVANFKFELIKNDNRNQPRGEFERLVGNDLKKIGFQTEHISQTPFNIIARENFLVLSDAEEIERKIKKNAPHLTELSNVVDKPIIVITKESTNLDIPSVERKQLREMTPRDLKRIASS